MKKFNCTRANQIPMIDILVKQNLYPCKRNKNEYLYISPFRNEKTPSFSVNIRKNLFYDFGEGCGGNNIDLIRKMKNCSVKEALQFFNQNFDSFSFSHPVNIQTNINQDSPDSKIKIKSIVPLSHPALLEYLSSRGISFSKVHEFIRQVHYELKGKTYFSIALKNDKGGFELKNKLVGNSTSPKYMSSIRNGKNKPVTMLGFCRSILPAWFAPNVGKRRKSKRIFRLLGNQK